MKKKITAGVLLILLLAGVCIQPAYANSAQRHWRGTDGTGAVVTGEDCPIVVDKELLTFDVQEFPEQYYPDTDSLCCQHPSCLFTDVDRCIAISVHLISARTAVNSFG